MRFIGAEEIHQRLDYPALVEALAECHRRDVDDVGLMVLEQPTPSGKAAHFLTGASWQRGQALGAKLTTLFPDNEYNDSGLPSVQAVYVLFDGTNGSPRAVIDGTLLTLYKTAADSALGARLLAPSAPERMLMVGAGALAPHLIRAHCAVRPSLKKVEIWNRTPERAEALATSLSLNGVDIKATGDLESAARRADIISCATMATEPLILGEWLKPGAHLDLVGSYRPSMHECDEAAVMRASVFVDSPWNAVKESGEIISALASGALVRSDILADTFALARGDHPGRTGDDEITLFKNGGGAHLDLMVAQYLCEGV